MKRQSGAALLLLALVLLLSISTWTLYSLGSPSARLTMDARTAESLQEAKAALIGRAAADISIPGSLPCPDSNDDGVSESLSGNECPTYVGRFPYKTLRTADLRDSQGERLWYALSRNFRDDDSAKPINSSTPTTLTLNGQVGYVAIVFAPGVPMENQNGRPSNDKAQYLDGTNATTTTDFISAPNNSNVNDIALGLTKQSLFAIVDKANPP